MTRDEQLALARDERQKVEAGNARPILRVISLGAGVQSTTLALLAKDGIVEMPDCAIFADTQAEPKAVYRHLDWLESVLPFPVHRVTAGSLTKEILGAMEGTNRMDARPPFHVETGGMLHRQCTQDFKIAPIQKKIRELIGVGKGERAPRDPVVEQWIGISLDEVRRMKVSRMPYIVHRWPLIELKMTRGDCKAWIEKHGYPIPAKSACTFCPYHDQAVWRALKQNPEDWAEAVKVDLAIRPGITNRGWTEPLRWFVHRDRVPLSEVDLSTEDERGQLDLFTNECEGMCGV